MNVCIFGKRGEGKTTYLKKRVVEPSLFPCIVIDTLDEYSDCCELVTIKEFVEFKKFKTRLLVDSDLDFQLICKIISRLQQKTQINLIVSEVDFWTSSYYIPKEFQNIIRYSRHYKLNIFCDVRNPVELNRRISALADRFIIFKITEPRYLDYFKQYEPALYTYIKRLQHFEHITYNL